MKVMLTGASGMLGSSFAEHMGAEVTAVGRSDLDVRQFERFSTVFAAHAPEIVINCAAHVDAEVVEDNPEPAFAANAILPGLLAVMCRRHGIPLVHFSSTGCYGSWKTSPYTEEDPVQPTTVHHRSKVSGERQVRDAGCEHLILRTGWLFGGGSHHKKNFVWRRLVEAMSTRCMQSDVGQKGCPTSVDDVVRQTLNLVRAGVRGTFNCVAQGEATRYDYVARILLAAGLDCSLVPAGPFKRLAPVSPNETAINARLKTMDLDQMPEWGIALERYVAEVTQWADYRELAAAKDKIN